jgi:hypothetical protein
MIRFNFVGMSNLTGLSVNGGDKSENKSKRLSVNGDKAKIRVRLFSVADLKTTWSHNFSW